MRIRRALGVCVVVAALALVAGPVPARADGGDPIGYLDSISARLGLNSLQPTNPGSRWALFGWAADPDAPGQPLDVHIYVEDASAAIPALMRLSVEQGIELSRVTYSQPTLDDVFLLHTGRELREQEVSA